MQRSATNGMQHTTTGTAAPVHHQHRGDELTGVDPQAHVHPARMPALDTQSVQGPRLSTPAPPPSAADARQAVEHAIGGRLFARYLSQDTKFDVRDGVLCVGTTNRFAADQIQRRFQLQLQLAADALGCEADPAVWVEARTERTSLTASECTEAMSTGAVHSKIRAQTRSASMPAPEPAAGPAPTRHTAGPDGDIDPQPMRPMATARPATEMDRAPHQNGTRISSRVDHAAGARAGSSQARNRSRESLEGFIVGESNRLAHAAAMRVANGLGSGGLSPMFLHGPCGNGKTHLLRGIIHGFKTRHPGQACRYTTAEAFTNGFVQAIRTNSMPAFQKRHRGLRLLCIDDAHFFCNKSATQTELVHTLDAIGMDGATVVLASDESPDRFEGMQDALRSRMCGGAIVSLGGPDPELRERIVRAKAIERGLPLDNAAVAAVAHGMSLTAHQPAGQPAQEPSLARGQQPGHRTSSAGPARSVREIEGALCRVEAIYRVMPELCTSDGRIGALMVSRSTALSGLGEPDIEPDMHRPVPMHAVVRTICRELCVENEELRGRGRHKRVVLARALITHVARETTNLSYPEIARAIGRPNHSTVITAHQRIRKQMAEGLEVTIGSRFDGLTVWELAQRVETATRRAAAKEGG